MKELFKTKPQKAIFLVGLFAVLLLTIVGVSSTFFTKTADKKDDNVLAVVAGEKITKDDLNKRIQTAFPDNNSFDEEQKGTILNRLIEEKIIFNKSKELNLTATEEEINNEIAVLLESESGKKDGLLPYAAYTESEKKATKDEFRFETLKKKVKENVLAWNEGSYILFRYDRYNRDIPETPGVTAAMTDSERESKKVELKKTALGFANQKVTELNAGKTYDEVYGSVVGDSVLGKPAWGEGTPRFGGVITKNEYFSDTGFTHAVAFKPEFNDAAFATEPGKASAPFNVKEGGKELDYYVVYYGKAKKDGYKWGYENWLSAEREKQLKKSALSKFGKYALSLIPEANAFSGDVCTDKTDRYCWKITTRIKPKSGTSYTAVPNYTIRLTTANNAIVIKDVNKGDTEDVSSTSDGVLWFSYGSSSKPDGSSYRDSYINCWKTNFTQFELRDGDVAVDNTIKSLGSWSYSFADDEGSDVSYVWDSFDQWNKPGVNTPAVKICMNNDTKSANGKCNPYDATKWANGDSGKMTFTWNPHYQDKPTAAANAIDWNGANKTTSNPANITLPEGSTTVPVRFFGKATDGNGDKVAIQVMYRKVGDAKWTNYGTNVNAEDPDGNKTALANGIKPSGYNVWGWSPHNGDDPTGTSGTEYRKAAVDLGVGSYEWAVRAMDEHGAYSANWSKKTFNIGTTPPPAAASCTVVGAGGNTFDSEVPATVTFSVTGFATGATIGWRVSYNGGAAVTEPGASGPTFTRSFTDRGSYVITPFSGSTDADPCEGSLAFPNSGNTNEVAP